MGLGAKMTKSQFLLSIMHIATKIHTTLIEIPPHRIHWSLYLSEELQPILEEEVSVSL